MGMRMTIVSTSTVGEMSIQARRACAFELLDWWLTTCSECVVVLMTVL